MEIDEYIEHRLVHTLHTSERRSFRSCRRRWNWAYQEYYYPMVTPRPLEFGIAYHEAMQVWYDPDMWSHPDHAEVGSALAITRFSEVVKQQLKNYIRLNGEPSPETLTDYKDRVKLGIEMVKYYTTIVSPELDIGFKPIAVETPFEVPLDLWCKCTRCWRKWINSEQGKSTLADSQRDHINSENEGPEDSYKDYDWKGLPVTYGGRIDMIALDEHGRLYAFDWKRLTLKTKIITPDGWKTMEEIKVGDFVIGADGQPTEVLGEKTWEPDTVYEVEFNDGTVVACSSDHLWQVYNAYNGKTEVLTTENIMNKPNYVRYSVDPISGPVEFDQKEYSRLPINPYVLGSLIGDGCFTGNILAYSSKSGETVELLRKYASDDVIIKDTRYYGSNNWQIYGPWRDQLKVLGLWKKRSREKRIPPSYLFASVEDRILLLQGLCDTDGNTGLLRWTTTGKELTADFRHLIWSLGGTADMTVSKERLHSNGKTINAPQYNVNYTFSTDIEPNQLERKRVGRVVRKRKTRRRIKEIRKTDRQEPMKCIYVDSDDSLYATENFVLTHNTTDRILDEDAEAAFLQLDDQVSSYVWALYQLNRPAVGFVYHEQRKAVPRPPDRLTRSYKGRAFSTAKNAPTTFALFKDTVLQHDRAAFYEGVYNEYLEWLLKEGPKFYQRHQILKNRTEIESIGEHIRLEAQDIIGNPRVYPQPGRFSCNSCLYRQPCLGMNMGEDYQYTLDTMFERRDRHYYEEKNK